MSSLFPEKATTATQSRDLFLKLMKTRPAYWAGNVAESVEHLKDEKEQIDFLRFMADPQGVVPGRNANCKLVDVDHTVGMENHPDYILTETVPGKIPTYRVTYKPRSQDDEKTE